ncbi:hypothetical protein M5689_011405 [Euphorbia peplus]|nr:hypothetical protein M5689_011405 [Euphorbia peplus]
MATNNSARESRRRKILERGSDRLALISGRSHSIPTDADSSQPLDPQLHRQDPTPQFSDKPFPSIDDGEKSCKLQTNDSVIDRGDNVEPPFCAPEITIQTSTTPASDVDNNEIPLLADQRSTTAGGVQLLEQLCSNRLVSPTQISSAITATESSRLLCSVIVAIFVVLSYLGFPLLGSNTVKSIICFRPLYLMLLTNLTLVLAQLLFSNQRGSNRIVGDSNVTSAKYDWAEQAGNALEFGLLMKKAMDALVMDCSIYAIIVIAGFCILH